MLNGQRHLCVVCDRPSCRHDAARYEDRQIPVSPVETEVGEAMRVRSLAVLRGRYTVLAESSKTYAFSSIEGTVMQATGRALQTLQAMAPLGDVRPARAADWWGTALSTAAERA